MRNFMKKIWHDKRGNAIVIVAATMPLLIGSAGLATDTIQWALWKRQLQRAADSAAIAGVYDRFANAGATATTSTAVSHDITLNHHTNITLEATYPKVTFPADAGNNKNQVKVELAVRRPLAFSAMFMKGAPLIKTTATAATISSSGEFCVLSLQKNSKTGIQATGSTTIQMDCGMMTNSTATNAAAGQGSANVYATTLAASGGISQSSNWHITTYQPYSPALEDPYIGLAPDSSDFSSCASSPPALSASNQTITGGGCYSSISVGSNKSLTLKDGIYIVNGGGLDVKGDLTVTNGTIVLTNKDSSQTAPVGSFDQNGNGSINITAPSTGKWAGLAIYQDRRAVDGAPTGNITSSSPNKINGSSTSKIIGSLYFPNQQLTYNGDGTGGATCTQFVAKRIYWSGNSGINNFTADCDRFGISNIRAPLKVRLIA